MSIAKMTTATGAIVLACAVAAQAQTTAPKAAPKAAPATTAAPAQGTMAPKGAQTGTEFYTAYMAAFAKMKKSEELLPFMSAERVKEFKSFPSAPPIDMLQAMGLKTALKVTKETATAKGATLTATGISADKEAEKGTVTLVKEGGAWKISEESWTNAK